VAQGSDGAAATGLSSLKELAFLFIRLGATSFGGPAAHIAMMEREVVQRRAWLSHEEFLDLIGATSLIPGPSSTEMAAYIGRLRAGLTGILVAGSCFILPAVLIVGVIAWAYMQFNTLPQVGYILYGVKPVVIAVVLQALWNLLRSAFKTKFLIAMGVFAIIASFAGANVLVILLGTGFIVAATRWITERVKSRPAPPSLLGFAPFGLLLLFLVFLKVGALLFGSGYVLLAFLRADLVQHYGWLSEGRLIDAIAIGQVTPGPVFTTATFIGYVLAGVPGAVVATVGIFLPSFFYVGLSAPLLPRVRRSPVAGAFFDGVNVGAIALMLFITWQLGRAAIVDIPTAIIAAFSATLLLATRLNPTYLIAGGAIIGFVLKLVMH
jgi:chromate transporter